MFTLFGFVAVCPIYFIKSSQILENSDNESEAEEDKRRIIK